MSEARNYFWNRRCDYVCHKCKNEEIEHNQKFCQICGENIDWEMEAKKRLEAYAIRISTGRSYQKGFDNRGKKIWEYEERYKTDAGEFAPQEWREKIKEAIEQAGEMELLESLRNYCREHCAWLHKELEIEDYAMDVLARRAYLYWDGFKHTDKSKYMVFNFKEG